MISVILPAFNAQATICEAIDSIINQTYRDWELIIINDGSKDNTKTIVESYNDSRIRLIDNPENKGLIYTLNRGLGMAKGEYIARMDADDISLPNRFEKQLSFMENNPKVIACGSYIKTFGKGVKQVIGKVKTSDKEIKDSFPLQGPFAHPAVMIRTSIIRDNNIEYNRLYKDAEDYKLWYDLIPFGEFANIPEVLLMYRISPTQVTNKSNAIQLRSASACRLLYIYNYIDKNLAKNLNSSEVLVKTIKAAKKYKNRYLIEALYLSLKPKSLALLFYYIYSLDCLKYGFDTFLKVILRFLNKRPSLFVTYSLFDLDNA